DRSTFGRDEIDALLLHGPAVVPNALSVYVDGYWPDKLGIASGSLSGIPDVKPSITVTPFVSGMTVTVTALLAEEPSLPVSPQRFTWLCQLEFSDHSGFPGNPGESRLVTLTASIAGLTASGQIELIHEPNPYEVDGETWWLSTDLRVFQIRAGETRFGA